MGLGLDETAIEGGAILAFQRKIRSGVDHGEVSFRFRPDDGCTATRHSLTPNAESFSRSVRMNDVRKRPGSMLALLALIVCAVVPALSQRTQSDKGSIEFLARAMPTVGHAEPVRQLTFYLLRKSLIEIEREADDAEPKHDLDKFVEKLSVSDELKAWMRKNQWVQLQGTEFVGRLKADDLLDVPEFYEAYLKRNTGDAAGHFPEPKYRQGDKTKHPEKYERQRHEYREAIRKFIEKNPQSLDALDVQLESINPGQKWAQQESHRRQLVHKRALDQALTQYLVANTESDLDGRGQFTGIPPGEYWISTLDNEAVAGDARLRWDTPVSVRARQVTRLELSNVNAAESQRASR